MTVIELINRLSTLPSDYVVCLWGHSFAVKVEEVKTYQNERTFTKSGFESLNIVVLEE